MNTLHSTSNVNTDVIDAPSECINETSTISSDPCRCDYCGFFDPNAVVQCEKCKRWFCNVHTSSAGSHYFQHVFHSKHSGCRLHKQNTICSNKSLECKKCTSRNILSLFFLKDSSTIICNGQCMRRRISSDASVKQSDFIPCMFEKHLHSSIVKDMTAYPESFIPRKLDYNSISRLEKLRMKNSKATFADLDNDNKLAPIPKATLTYNSKEAYIAEYQLLVDTECEYEHLKSQTTLYPVRLQWSKDDSGYLFYATFNLRETAINAKLKEGASVRITYDSDSSLLDETITKVPRKDLRKWILTGVVFSNKKRIVTIRFPVTRYFANETEENDYYWFMNYSEDFFLRILPNGAVYDRMKRALINIFQNSSTLFSKIPDVLLGHTSISMIRDSTITIKSNISNGNLNASQIDACTAAHQSPVVLIQGPPGTGKTHTGTSIIKQLLENNKETKILVCAPSNAAVDNISKQLLANNIPILRVMAKSLHDRPENLQNNVCLHSKVYQHLEELESPFKSSLSNIYKRYIDRAHMPMKEQRYIEKIVSKIEHDIMKENSVVCCTCACAGDIRFDNIEFPIVLIDEAAQSIEPVSLIPMSHGCNKLIMIGDDDQLAPIVLSIKADRAGLSCSMFNRLHRIDNEPVCLLNQYRMHPYISKFPNTTFYNGRLIDDICTQNDVHDTFCWPVASIPLMFWNCDGFENVYSTGISYMNPLEANYVFECINYFMSKNVPAEDIGVISPYKGQENYLLDCIEDSNSKNKSYYEKVTIASIDAFQGSEKKYIIISCVRSNESLGLGFLSIYNRLNVAITRAKAGLIIIGNVKTLQKNILWNNLLHYYSNLNCIVDGPQLTTCEYYKDPITDIGLFVKKYENSDQVILESHELRRKENVRDEL